MLIELSHDAFSSRDIVDLLFLLAYVRCLQVRGGSLRHLLYVSVICNLFGHVERLLK